MAQGEKNRAQQQAEAEYQAGWQDRTLLNEFLKLPEGRHALMLLEEPIADVNDFGKDRLTFKVMTRDEEKGTFSTSSLALMIPLAKASKQHGALRGAVLAFLAEGEDTGRRYKEVLVFATGKEYTAWAVEQQEKRKAETLPGFGVTAGSSDVPF